MAPANDWPNTLLAVQPTKSFLYTVCSPVNGPEARRVGELHETSRIFALVFKKTQPARGPGSLKTVRIGVFAAVAFVPVPPAVAICGQPA